MAKYRVQRDDNVETLDEKKLRKKLRSNDLSGLELVRREDDERWVPLCETELFRDEVPFRGHPLDAARRREVEGFFGHLTAWVIVAGIMGALGSWFPFWLLLWGVFLGVHGAKVVPSALGLLAGGQRLGPGPQASLPASTGAEQKAIAPPAEPGSPLADEVAHIRALLSHRDDAQATRLSQEVDRLVVTLRELARRRVDLASQLSPDELQNLEKAREETRRRLEDATSEQDRDLLQQELDAADQRHEAVEHAQRTLDRMQSQARVAEHQLKQLRLDLSQAEARAVDVPDFADRVESIRLETAAVEEVEEALAESRPKGR